MSLEEFVCQTLEENHEDMDELRKLAEILDQLQKEEQEIYLFSITSNL